MKIYRSLIKTAGLCSVILASFFAVNINAATITGDMGFIGNYTADGSVLTLGSAVGTSGADDLGTTVSFGTVGTINNGVITYSPFSSAPNVLTIGGWNLDLTALTIVDANLAALKLSGTAILSGNGYDPTAAEWNFSAQTGTAYSISVATIPVPAAMWLFGSAVISLVTVGRKRIQN